MFLSLQVFLFFFPKVCHQIQTKDKKKMAIPYLIGSKQYFDNLRMQHLSWELANTAVNGHKRMGMSLNALEGPFKKHMHHGVKSMFYPVPGIQWRDRAAGAMEKTDNPFHVAIQGPGFFELANGTYTRDGFFSTNEEGTLVSVIDGTPILSASGDPIVIPEDVTQQELSISSNGEISDGRGNSFGELSLVEFDDLNTLKDAGDNRYVSDEAPNPAIKSRTMQGMLERSNGQPAKILVEASSTRTDYQMLGAMARRYDETYHQLNNHLLHLQG